MKDLLIIDREDVVAIAGAVRDKTGLTTEMTLSEMIAGIGAIQAANSTMSWNDLTDKPFYEEGSRVLLIEETKFEGFTQNPDYGLYFAYGTKPFSLSAGETYTVLWDDGEYVVTALDASAVVGGELIAMGDGSAWGLPGNEEPFIIATDAVSMYFFASDPNDSAVSHDVGIYQGAITVKPLDQKYLPMDAIDARIEAYISSALEGDY